LHAEDTAAAVVGIRVHLEPLHGRSPDVDFLRRTNLPALEAQGFFREARAHRSRVLTFQVTVLVVGLGVDRIELVHGVHLLTVRGSRPRPWIRVRFGSAQPNTRLTPPTDNPPQETVPSVSLSESQAAS